MSSPSSNNLTIKIPQTSMSLPLCLELNDLIPNVRRPRKTSTLGMSEYSRLYDERVKLYGKWYSSEKIDGVRAIWDGKKLLTRSMREFTYVPSWFIQLLPKFCPLDGEIVVEGKPFNYISSISITKKSEEVDKKWKEITYYVFDTPNDKITFENRLLRLKKYIQQINSSNVKIVDFEMHINIKKDFHLINNKFNKIIKKGGEGLMLIKADSFYESKRSNNSLKYKKEHHGEAEVIELHEGKGKYYHKLGKFKCKLKDTGKTFFCGSGLTDEIRNMYHFDRTKCYLIEDDTPDLKVPRIGDTISYSCMEILPSGVPRMAVYRGLRHD